MCGRKDILNNRDHRVLEVFVKYNRKIETQELTYCLIEGITALSTRYRDE